MRKQNRLPLETYRGPGAYALSIVTQDRRPAFAEAAVTEHCLAVLRSEDTAFGFDVFAYCFMPDHLHLLIGSEDRCDVIGFVKVFKQKTGYWYKQRPAGGLKASPTGVVTTTGVQLWQRSFHGHVVRSEESLRKLAEYALDNPVVAGLAEERGHYRWAGSFVWDDLYG